MKRNNGKILSRNHANQRVSNELPPVCGCSRFTSFLFYPFDQRKRAGQDLWSLQLRQRAATAARITPTVCQLFDIYGT